MTNIKKTFKKIGILKKDNYLSIAFCDFCPVFANRRLTNKSDRLEQNSNRFFLCQNLINTNIRLAPKNRAKFRLLRRNFPFAPGLLQKDLQV